MVQNIFLEAYEKNYLVLFGLKLHFLNKTLSIIKLLSFSS